MSSHEMQVATAQSLKLKPGTTMKAVFDALAPFFDYHLNLRDFKDMEQAVSQGSGIELYDTSFEVTGDHLTFQIKCVGGGHGSNPAGPYQEAIESLEGLLAEGGCLVITDHEISAANPEARVFVLLTPEGSQLSDDEVAAACAASRITEVLNRLTPEQRALVGPILQLQS